MTVVIVYVVMLACVTVAFMVFNVIAFIHNFRLSCYMKAHHFELWRSLTTMMGVAHFANTKQSREWFNDTSPTGDPKLDELRKIGHCSYRHFLTVFVLFGVFIFVGFTGGILWMLIE